MLKRLEALVRLHLEAALRDRGVTSGQFMLLTHVAGEDGVSSAELARRMSVTPQSMNESIAALESKGLIRRTEDRDNRRILRIALTSPGRRLLTACDKAVDRLEADVFGALSPVQLRVFRTSLEAVLDAGTDAPLNGSR